MKSKIFERGAENLPSRHGFATPYLPNLQMGMGISQREEIQPDAVASLQPRRK
jgi:hypothetical protein